MASYRLGPMAPAAGIAPSFERAVVCECCGQVLGVTVSMQYLTSVPGKIAARLWPEVETAVRQHEALCPVQARAPA